MFAEEQKTDIAVSPPPQVLAKVILVEKINTLKYILNSTTVLFISVFDILSVVETDSDFFKGCLTQWYQNDFFVVVLSWNRL